MESIYIPKQTVQDGQPFLFNTSIPCNKGYVIHRNGSGLHTLRGIVNNQFSCFARYQVTFNGNVAIPEGGTAGPIAVAIAISGEPVLSSKAIVTPTVADSYFNLTSTAFITVPKGCCVEVSVVNATGGGVAIDGQNANLVVTRVA